MCLPYSVTPSNYAFCDGWQRLIRRSTPANGDGQWPNPEHIRLVPVTRGLTPSNRVWLPHTRGAPVSGYAALRLPSARAASLG